MLPQLRFGRALDNRRYKATGFVYQHTTRETVLRLREQQRLAPILRGAGSSYRYEAAVEEFLRFSPSVHQANARPQLAPANSAPRARLATLQQVGSAEPAERDAPSTPYASLPAREILSVLPSLSREDLETLRAHEAAHARRATVLKGIDRLLGTAAASGS
jgi:UDP-glucose 4-epimerase